MNFDQIWASIQDSLGSTLPNLLAALAILIVGWLVAVLFRAGSRKALHALSVNERVGRSTDGDGMDIEGGVAKGVFWLIMMFVLIAFFNKLDLGMVSQPLQSLLTKVTDYVPNLVGGGILALVAWIVATLLRKFSTKALAATNLDEKLAAEADMPMSANLGNVLYWFILLLFLPMVLDKLGLHGILAPIQNMLDKIFAMLPNILGAAVIGLVAYFVAKILRDLVFNLLSAANFDRFGQKLGLTGNVGPSKLVSILTFVFVFVPLLIQALNTLKIESISGPATGMLDSFMNAIPNLFAAAVIIGIAYVLAKFVSGLVADILDGLGFNQLPAKLGLTSLANEGGFQVSSLAGRIVSFFIMLFAAVEAANRLEFTQVSEVVTMFIKFGGQIVLGAVILAVGVWLANLVHGAILRVSGDQSRGMASIGRFAILGLVAAMGLRAMGIADDIVNMAFALTLGSIAVAIALSFGLGGREAAGKQMEYWLSKYRR